MNLYVTRMCVVASFVLLVNGLSFAPAKESNSIQQVHNCADDCYDNLCCGTTGGCTKGCDSGCSEGIFHEPCRGKTCEATFEKEKVEKHCWKVECQEICVPKVVCPWQEGGSGLTLFSWLKKSKNPNCGNSWGCADGCCDQGCCVDDCCNSCCCKPRCGKVIVVRDLKKEKYECEECVCKWDIRRLPPCTDCCDCGCDPSCGCGPRCGD